MSKKETTFTLNGKEYTLKFSMRVPLYWEQATSLTDILTLVWAAFKNGGCTLSLEELAEQLSDKDLQVLSTKVMGLVADNSTPAKTGDEEPPLAVAPQR